MTKTSEERLMAMADGEPWRDGFHLPILGNTKLSIEVEYGKLLKDEVVKRKPNTILEVGTGHGYSTAWLLLGVNENNQGRVHTFDTEERIPLAWELANVNTERLNQYVKAFPLNDMNSIPMIDFAFHDAGHRYEFVKKDIDAILPKLDKRAVIFIHDVYYDGVMGEMVKRLFESFPGWNYSERKESCGMGIAEKGE